MTARRVVVRFAPELLRTNHAGLDLEASAARYRDELTRVLRDVIRAESVDVLIDDVAGAMRVEISEADPSEARAIERDVLDHAWVVRQMGTWAVIS